MANYSVKAHFKDGTIHELDESLNLRERLPKAGELIALGIPGRRQLYRVEGVFEEIIGGGFKNDAERSHWRQWQKVIELPVVPDNNQSIIHLMLSEPLGKLENMRRVGVKR